MAMAFTLGLLICIPLFFASPSESAVCSVDLGSEWLKVAVVNLKPGQSPISIAINEMSKRKSPALVAFHAGNRLLGEEAAGLAARFPDKVYSQVRDALRKPFNYTKRFFDSLYLPFDLIKDSRGLPVFRIGEEEVYSGEELLAMILGYAIKLAEFHSKVDVKDAVITVPPFLGQAEREGIFAASQLAGINVLSLVNEYVGAALQYGIDKDFSNGSRHVIFYDMGASSTYAALVYYSAYNTKEHGKTVSVNQFQVKDVRWDSGLGGQNMELRMMDHFADEFNNKIGDGIDIRKSSKAMAKLRKQVKRTKEILSANTIAPISVESIFDDRDFRSTMTREKLEDLCEDLWQRALTPIKEVLKHSELKIDDISAVELIGGATRVPKVQAMLQEFLGRKDLDKHLDADEAIVLGAALHAANISDGIKLNRKFGMIDGSLYGITLEMNAPDIVEIESTKHLLVPRMKKMPSKMFRSIVRDKDFEVSLAYDSEDLLPHGVPSPIFSRHAISGLSDAKEKHLSRNISAPIKANLHFSLSRSGILSLDRADAVIEVSEWVDVPQKGNLTVDNSTTDSLNISTESTFPSNSTEDSANANFVDTSNTSSENKTMGVVIEKKLKKRTYRIPLKIMEITEGPVRPYSKEFLAEGKRKLEVLDKRDVERRRTAELKNNLEGYIYATKDKLELSEELKQVLADDEKETFIKKLDEVQEWLYMDGEDASASEFEHHLNLLKSTGDPIFLRLNELTARPAACQYARTYITDLQKTVHGWEVHKPWLPKDRIQEVLDDSETLKEWLHQKEEEQSRISRFEMPVFTSAQAYQRIKNLQDKVASMDRIPKPKPKIEKAAKEEVHGSDAPSPSQGADQSTPSEELPAGDEQLVEDAGPKSGGPHDEL